MIKKYTIPIYRITDMIQKLGLKPDPKQTFAPDTIITKDELINIILPYKEIGCVELVDADNLYGTLNVNTNFFVNITILEDKEKYKSIW